MSKFWKKVVGCKHENLTNYFVSFGCPTPYCDGYELHCKDCGVYISKCKCHYNNGMSGWSNARRKARTG